MAKFEVEIAKRTVLIDIELTGDSVKAVVDGRLYEASLLMPEQNIYTLFIGDRIYELSAEQSASNGEIRVCVNGSAHLAKVSDPKKKPRSRKPDQAGAQSLSSPMPGRVVKLLKAVGDSVEAGEGVAIVEAMKMQNEIASPKTGRVASIKVKTGQTVSAGETLAVVE